MQNLKVTPLNAALLAAIALTLTACGGGGSSTTPDTTPAPVPPPVTLKGNVYINQGVQNAVVCMDLNSNNLCDSNEPTSAKTSADGAYVLTYDPSVVTAAQVAAAPVIANISAIAVDAGNPSTPVTSTNYVLSAPAAQSAQINPLTTLVQTGIASGLTKATSDAAVALQMGVPAADIYNYQTNAALIPSAVADNARNMAQVVVSALAAGVKLSVIDPASTATATASDQLVSLSFTDSNNYLTQTYPTDNKANIATGKINLTDVRTGKTAGVSTPNDTLYPRVFLTSAGWVRCNAVSAFTATLGNPSRSSYCAGNSLSVGYTISNVDISGQKMSDVVTQMQTATDNSNGITTLLPSVLGTAVFPANSKLRTRTSVSLEQNLYINNVNTDGGVAGATTLEQVVVNRPTSKVNLQTGSSTVGLGLIDSTHALRAAYKDAANAVQYYSCDYVAATNSISNCSAITTGTFTISTVNGARTMMFSAQPNPSQSAERGLVEYNGGVYITRQSKADIKSSTSNSQRLDGTAWTALKMALGL